MVRLLEDEFAKEKERLIAIVQKYRDDHLTKDRNPINILNDIIKEMNQ